MTIPNNNLSIQAQSNSSSSSSKAEFIAKSSTDAVSNNKKRYETTKEAKNRVNKHRTNIKIIAAYSSLAFGLFIVGYLLCFYISHVPTEIKQKHLIGIIDYVGVNGIPAAVGAVIFGCFMWIFKDK